MSQLPLPLQIVEYVCYEFEQLFAHAGLTLQRILPTDSAYNILEVSHS